MKRTLSFLRNSGLAVPATDPASRRPADWVLTEDGLTAYRQLVIEGIACRPGESGFERAKFDQFAVTHREYSRARRGKVPAEISVLTWNLRWGSDPIKTLAHLEKASWDVACLQEVGLKASNLINERSDWSVYNGLARAWGERLRGWRSPHGAVLVARNGWKLHEGRLIAGPIPGRGVSAIASREKERLAVVSWHAPNAVPGREERKADAIARKMVGYSAFLFHIESIKGPLVAGIDANYWNLLTDLDLPDPSVEDDPFHIQNRFFSNDPTHRLRDALLDYLSRNSKRHRALVKRRPHGPLEITHRRGGHGKPDRFDYLMISKELEAKKVCHDFEGSIAASSDHGLVQGSLVASGRR